MIYFLLPFVAALIGWLMAELAVYLVFTANGQKGFFAVAQRLLSATATRLGAELSTNDLQAKFTAPGNLQKIMPEVEQHIDHFLRVKLKVSMPMIGMLVGERTINQMKDIFMKELEELFPVIMISYVGKMRNELDLTALLETKLRSIPPAAFAAVIRQAVEPLLVYFKLFAAAIGLVTGCLYLLVHLVH